MNDKSWGIFCVDHGDREIHMSGFYASYERASREDKDYELCVKEANEGDERAIRYLTGFAKFRMQS